MFLTIYDVVDGAKDGFGTSHKTVICNSEHYK